jgi:hypothetical protein
LPKDKRKLLMSLVNELSTNISAASYKTTEEHKLLLDYLSGNDGGQNSAFFRDTMKANKNQDLGIVLWTNALKYLQMSVLDTDEDNEVNEKRGGVQLVFNFNDKRSQTRKSAHKRSAIKQE